ncbi:MAG: hypothetical protein JW870_20865, partial [Candidatus Delongbacteria bacterium]|nr:hypothetical protein [Candidatus Delongbacteria bacterium]
SVIRFGSMIIIGFKSKLWPLGLQHLKAIIASIIVFVLISLIPKIENLYVDGVIRGIVMFAIFITLSLFFKISDEVCLYLKAILKYFKIYYGKH